MRRHWGSRGCAAEAVASFVRRQSVRGCASPKLSRFSCAVRACAGAPRRSCRECAASWAVAAAYALVFPRRSRSVRECASPKLARVCVSDVRAGVHFFHGSLPMCESLSVVMVHLVPHVPVRDRRTEELSVVHRRPRYRLRWNPSQARARVCFLSPFFFHFGSILGPKMAPKSSQIL